ncbi:MAG: type II toxin-antitoxin system PemK/MazF family toxin [bacterium]|nr:type II toxin-antitoxin system PemK/MazF family toxin [bacterium]
MNKGEIWLVEIPPTNGYEQKGTRPVLVLSPVEANVVIIIPFTSNMSALRFPHTLEMFPSPTNGLKVTSVALIFQLRAIDRKRLKRKLGKVSAEILRQIDDMIKDLLSLEVTERR